MGGGTMRARGERSERRSGVAWSELVAYIDLSLCGMFYALASAERRRGTLGHATAD